MEFKEIKKSNSNLYLLSADGGPFALIEILKGPTNKVKAYLENLDGESHPSYPNLKLAYEGPTKLDRIPKKDFKFFEANLTIFSTFLEDGPFDSNKVKRDFHKFMKSYFSKTLKESDFRNYFVAKKISVPNTKLAYGFYFNEELFGVLQIKDHFQYGPILEIYLKYNGRDPHILFSDLYLVYEREAPYQLTDYILRKTAETLWIYKKIFENPKIDYEEYEDKLGEDLDKIFKPLRKAKKLYKIEPTESMNIIAKRLGTPNTIYSFLLSTSDGEDFAIVEAERDELYGPTFKIYLKGANLYDEHSIYEDFGVVYENNLPKTLTKGMLRKIGEVLYKYVNYNRLPDTIAEDIEDEIGEELDPILKNS